MFEHFQVPIDTWYDKVYYGVQSIKQYGMEVNKVGYRVKELREVLNMTQEDLAQKSGVSRGTISAMENGSSKATSTRTFVKIARALGTSVDSIFFDEDV